MPSPPHRRRRSPSFFKILLDASAPHLPLPPDFVTRHLENRIPQNPMIRSVIRGFNWRVKLMKIGETLCFSRGWNSVVEDMELGFGDFLIFRFVDRSAFDMIVFSPNGCEKDLPPQQIDDDVVDDVIDDEEEERVEDKVEDEDEEEFEEGDEDEEEGEYEDEDKENGEEEEDDGDGDGDEEVDGGIDGNDGDPFFMLTISKSHKTSMRLPTEFVDLTGIYGEGTLTLKNLDDVEWEMGLRQEERSQSERRYYISSGWPDFRRSNDLCEGDECVFKFITSEEKLLLAKVNKKKQPARESGVKRKQNSERSPTEKVEKRVTESPARELSLKRNRGQQNSRKVENSEVKPPARELRVRRNRGRQEENSGKTPAKKVEKRDMEKRPRGRPARKK